MATKAPFSVFKGGRVHVPAEYASPEFWPLFDESMLKGKTLSRFRSLRIAVGLYLGFSPMDEVLAAAGVSQSRFGRLFRRCGEVQSNGKIVGFSALVAYNEPRTRQRRLEITAEAGGSSGWSGAFTKLLKDHPEIQKGLTDYLIARNGKNSRPNRVEFLSIHQQFLTLCGKDIKDDEYPFNTKERGRKSLRRWVDDVFMSEHASRYISLEYGPEAGKLHGYGEGDGKAELPAAPFSVWSLDEVTLDLAARYEFPAPSGDWEELDLARCIQIRLIDEGSGTNLACNQVYAAQASADDISKLFWDGVNGPDEITKAYEGEVLLEGAGYPAKIHQKLRFAIPMVIKLDRALAHLADHVQYIGTVLFGARVILGPARTPHERAAVESRFSTQARRVVHQLPATTGSSPKDPVRARARVALEGRVHALELAYLLDTYVQNENATPHAASFNIAPLERLRRQLEAGVLQPRYLAPDRRKPYYFSKPVRVTVRADLARGERPYVNYLYMRYSGAELGKDYAIVGKPLVVRSDLRNLQTVMLFRESGEVYGQAQVLGRWGTFPHDQRMRRLFARLKREAPSDTRPEERPLEAMFIHLRKKAATDRKAALGLTQLVEYLRRSEVQVSSELTIEIQQWHQLQSEMREVAVLPYVPKSVVDQTPSDAVARYVVAPRPTEIAPTVSETSPSTGSVGTGEPKPPPLVARPRRSVRL